MTVVGIQHCRELVDGAGGVVGVLGGFGVQAPTVGTGWIYEVQPPPRGYFPIHGKVLGSWANSISSPRPVEKPENALQVFIRGVTRLISSQNSLEQMVFSNSSSAAVESSNQSLEARTDQATGQVSLPVGQRTTLPKTAPTFHLQSRGQGSSTNEGSRTQKFIAA